METALPGYSKAEIDAILLGEQARSVREVWTGEANTGRDCEGCRVETTLSTA